MCHSSSRRLPESLRWDGKRPLCPNQCGCKGFRKEKKDLPLTLATPFDHTITQM
ncbi:unnamed protein product [Knipowitschia caucasica]